MNGHVGEQVQGSLQRNRVPRAPQLSKWEPTAIYYQMSSLGDAALRAHDAGMTLGGYYTAQMSVLTHCNVLLR
jgi:hypothetical protein